MINEVRDSGTLLVHGECGTVMEVHSTNCAPCHMPNFDTTIKPWLKEIPLSHTCYTCGSHERPETMLICDGCIRGFHLHCLVPPLDAIPEESPWCCPTCIQNGITPATLDTLLRQDLQKRGLDRPVLRDVMQEMEEKAAAMNGQLVLLRILSTGRASQNVTAALKYLPPDQRAKHARRPLLVELAGFVSAQIAVGPAQKATRNRLDIHLDPLPDAAMAMHITMVFVASEAQRLVPPSAAPGLADTYDLYSLAGYTGLYHAVLGTVKGCPTAGTPTDWAPELSWVMDSSQPATLEVPLSAADVQLLISSIDINSCARVADPAAQSVPLQAMLHNRYQRKLLATTSEQPHPANWLSPRYYRLLAKKGPVDWTFLLDVPLSLSDLALALAISQSRAGVAMWTPRCFLTNLSATRLALLTMLKSQRRLAIVQHDSPTSNYLWVCCFTTATHRTRMLCPCSTALGGWTSI